MLPLNNPRITSPYGITRSDGKVHKGIDIISTSGDRQVKAIKDGVVRGTFVDPYGFGNYVSIQHADGMRALYCHLEEFRCRAGDNVKAGDVIGIEGETGNSTGVHLHLEIREPDYTPSKHIDVAKYLGIKNIRGDIVVSEEEPIYKKELTREEKIQLVKEKVGYDDNTCKYIFDFYKYGNEALDKLTEALQGNG